MHCLQRHLAALSDIAMQCPVATWPGRARPSTELNWRAQRGSLDAPSLYAAPYSRFERGGLYGCERQVKTCPRHAKARSFWIGRTGIMLADVPYHFLLKLQEGARHFTHASSARMLAMTAGARSSLKPLAPLYGCCETNCSKPSVEQWSSALVDFK